MVIKVSRNLSLSCHFVVENNKATNFRPGHLSAGAILRITAHNLGMSFAMKSYFLFQMKKLFGLKLCTGCPKEFQASIFFMSGVLTQDSCGILNFLKSSFQIIEICNENRSTSDLQGSRLVLAKWCFFS